MKRKYLFTLKANINREGKTVLTTEGNVMMVGDDPPTEELVKQAVSKFCWAFNTKSHLVAAPIGPSEVCVSAMMPLEFVDNHGQKH